MNLTEQQVRVIQEWAARARHITEVRLFGSRARGCAPPGSDVDLAVTVGGTIPGTVLGIYCAFRMCWPSFARA
jgi:predicted nucleotidyltransferase